MPPEIYEEALRLRGYNWHWAIVASIVNRRHGTEFTARQLERKFEAEQKRRSQSAEER